MKHSKCVNIKDFVMCVVILVGAPVRSQRLCVALTSQEDIVNASAAPTACLIVENKRLFSALSFSFVLKVATHTRH